MLNKIKAALWIGEDAGTAYDGQLTDLALAALADMGLTDITSAVLSAQTTDPLIMQAVITYCRMNFGSPADYDRLKKSYDEQKAQLITATGYGFGVI